MGPPVARSACADHVPQVTPDAVGALADQLRVTTVRRTRQLRRRDRSGLGITQYAALASVVDHGALSIGGLAASEHQSSPAASRLAALSPPEPDLVAGGLEVLAAAILGEDAAGGDRRDLRVRGRSRDPEGRRTGPDAPPVR